MKFKKTLITLLLFVSAIILGEFIGRMSGDISALSWLSYAVSFGVPVTQPFVLDLSVLKLALGFYLTINVAQIILLVFSIFLYKPLLKKL